jgi:catechol 2,3-dioxygenase-like lactoylglutathione lyase family enzyme
VEFNALVPELTVTSLEQSLPFYFRLGFKLEYGREGFVFLSLQGAQLMLEQFHDSGWNTAELERPFGRGINFQIEVEDIAPMLEALRAIQYPLYRQPYETWRKVQNEEIGEAEFLVQDPDGYLLRFSQYLGSRPISPSRQ